MEPKAFEAWLGGEATGSLAETGEQLFKDLGCSTCHTAKKGARGPTLHGIFGKHVQLKTGEKVLVDEAYLRESILTPQKKIVASYQPIMPSYVAQLNEEKVIQLIAYIRSLEKSNELEPEIVPTASATAEPVSPQGGNAGKGGAGGAGSAKGATGAGGAGGTGGAKGAGGEGFTP
jgi:cytochrome c2